MQKHQWRQHGIVHIKKGLPETSTLEISNQTEIRPIVSYAPPISSTRTEEQFSYSHILKDNPSETPIKLRMKMEYQKLNHVEQNPLRHLQQALVYARNPMYIKFYSNSDNYSPN